MTEISNVRDYRAQLDAVISPLDDSRSLQDDDRGSDGKDGRGQ
jgi:hypothetical protein